MRNSQDSTSHAALQSADAQGTSPGAVTPLSGNDAESTSKPQRTANGRFLPGNTTSRKHGFTAARISEALIAERQAFEAQSLADDGDDVPVRRASRLHYRARLHVQIVMLSDALEHFGLFDKRNRLRVTWLQRLEGLVAQAARLDLTLGDERRSKPLNGMSAAEWASQQPNGGSDGA